LFGHGVVGSIVTFTLREVKGGEREEEKGEGGRVGRERE
jgi:hypothetical protein